MMGASINLAPMQLIALAFDNLSLDGRIIAAVHRLEQRDMISIIDAVALAKTIDDEIIAVEMTDLPRGEAGSYGSIIRRLLRLEVQLTNEAQSPAQDALGAAMLVDSEYEYGMTPEELQTLLEDIPRRGGVAILLVEHLWALPLKQAVRESGGILLAQDFLSPETLASVAPQLLRAR